MYKIHLISFSLLLTAFMSTAQKEITQNQWDFKLGYENTRLLDRQNSPLVYSAHSATLGTGFSRTKSKSVWGLSLATAIGSSQSKRFGQRTATFKDPYDIYGVRETYVIEGNPSLSYVHLNMTYTYLRKLTIGQKDFRIGADLGNDFFMSGIGLDTWFFNNLSLSPVISTQFKLSDAARVPVTITFPLLSYVVREPFAKDPSIPLDNYIEANIKTGASVATLDTFQKMEFTVGYRRDWKSNWDIGLDYTFYWYHYQHPDHLRAYSNQLSIVLSKNK